MAILAGQKLRASDFTEEVWVKKAVSESLGSSTTLQDDDHIQLALEKLGIWVVKLNASCTGAAAGDIKIAWTLSNCSQHTTRHCIGPGLGTADVTASAVTRMSTHSWATAVPYGTDGSATTGAIKEEGLIEVTNVAATVQMQWAQNTSNAAVTTVSANTFAKARYLGPA